jgi:2-succinyl-5-enolpyruvyl-6-hydroxy-3-cyclohexene-1-carboxylate synthase
MGINSKRIDNANDLVKELKSKVEGLSVVVLDVPNREANANQIKELTEKMKSL